ncbi:MAG TPA: lysophospholipid acyltransferase family protein [Polyangiaceae bacterium]
MSDSLAGLGRALLGIALGVVARLWLATLRVHVVRHPALDAVRGRPWVLAFWHGTQWPLLAWRRRRRTVVLVSLSRDGTMQARALALQGLRVVRGSSSRGGARGLAALVRAMKQEQADAAFAVDGPRGPHGVVKSGAIVAARATGAVVVPMTGGVRRGVVLGRTWDRFAIAWPFTRVDVVLGAPIDPRQGDDPRAQVQRSLAHLNEELAAA